MSTLLRAFVSLAGLFLIIMAIRSIVTRHLTEQQSYFWIFSGIGIIIFGLFPQVSAIIAQIFGVDYIPSIIFMIAIVIAIFGIFSCFQAIAILNKRVHELAMQVSLLNRENSLLIKACNDMGIEVVELQQVTATEEVAVD